MDIGKYISELIDCQGRDKKWVAEKIGVQYRTFLYRLEKNGLLADDLLKLSRVLTIDLNELAQHVLIIQKNAIDFNKEEFSEIKDAIKQNLKE